MDTHSPMLVTLNARVVQHGCPEPTTLACVRAVHQALAELLRDRSGGVSVEYVVVTMVGLMIATALGGLGLAMVDAFGASLRILYSEYP